MAKSRQAKAFTAFTPLCLMALLLFPPALASAEGDFIFRGIVESIHAEQGAPPRLQLRLVGFDVAVTLSDAARLRTGSGNALALEEIRPGSSVEIVADWSEQGFIAGTVTVNDSEQVSAIGRVETLTADGLVVSGVEFRLDDQSGAAAAQVQVGQLLAVLGTIGQDGVLKVTQLATQEQFWLFGKITAKDDAKRAIVVAGKTILVADKTIIAGPDKTKLAYGDLRLGQSVTVTGTQSAGTLTAGEVRVAETNTRVELRGALVSFNSSSITVQSAGTPFQIKTDAKTEIIGQLILNALVSVSAILQSDGLLLATKIVANGGDGNKGNTEAILGGTIEKISADLKSIVVGGVTVVLNETTTILSNGKGLRRNDLKVGDKVKIKGSKLANGTISAAVIEVVSDTGAGTETSLVGAIEKIAADRKSIVVGGITVQIAERTTIRSDQKTLTPGDLKVGDQVKIMGSKQAGGAILATWIEVLPGTSGGQETAFDGVIEKIASDLKSIVVRGVIVMIIETTVIRAGEKNLKPTDLKLNDKVKVKGLKQANGSVIATYIFVI